MELHQLQYVVELAQQKNFTRAADRINVSQSTLSHQVAKLEEELGIKLFERTSRTVSLTQAGEDFVSHARNLLNELENAKQSIQGYRGLLKGTLRMGVIASLGRIDYANMVAAFYRQYPGINFEIVQAGTYPLLEKLAAKELELAFVVMPQQEQYKELRFQPLATDDYVLALPRSHPLAGRGSIDLVEVADENFIFHPATDRMFSTCLEACQAAGFQPRIVCESSHSPTCLSLICAGMGIGFFPLEKLQKPVFDVAIVRLAQPLKKEIVLAVGRESALTPVADRFYRFALQWVKDLRLP